MLIDRQQNFVPNFVVNSSFLICFELSYLCRYSFHNCGLSFVSNIFYGGGKLTLNNESMFALTFIRTTELEGLCLKGLVTARGGKLANFRANFFASFFSQFFCWLIFGRQFFWHFFPLDLPVFFLFADFFGC